MLFLNLIKLLKSISSQELIHKGTDRCWVSLLRGTEEDPGYLLGLDLGTLEVFEDRLGVTSQALSYV